jgi:hypothetical protein
MKATWASESGTLGGEYCQPSDVVVLAPRSNPMLKARTLRSQLCPARRRSAVCSLSSARWRRPLTRPITWRSQVGCPEAGIAPWSSPQCSMSAV